MMNIKLFLFSAITLVATCSLADQSSQLFYVDGGAFHPSSVTLNNGDYQFSYNGKSLSTFQIQAGWSLELLQLGGGWSFDEGLSYSNLQGASTVGDSFQLNILGLDSQILYGMSWFPWKMLTPFVEGGYLISFYSQSGSSDLQSVQGSVGNLNASAGLRLWVNRETFQTDDVLTKYTNIPFYILLKVQYILANNQSLDLSSTNYLGGLAIAL